MNMLCRPILGRPGVEATHALCMTKAYYNHMDKPTCFIRFNAEVSTLDSVHRQAAMLT